MSENHAKVAETLHTAICQAMALMNRSPGVATCHEGRQAHEILRQALIDHTEACMGQRTTESVAIGADGECETQKMADARKVAHDALTAAERAWYEYAGQIDVGPDRTRAFEIYENVRNARRV